MMRWIDEPTLCHHGRSRKPCSKTKLIGRASPTKWNTSAWKAHHRSLSMTMRVVGGTAVRAHEQHVLVRCFAPRDQWR